MRGAGAAKEPSDARSLTSVDTIQSLREDLLRLEAHLQELKNRLRAYEDAGEAPAAQEALVPEPVALGSSLRDALGYGFNLAGVVALALAVGYIARFTIGKGSAISLGAVIAGCAGLALLARFFRRREATRLALWLEGGAVGVGYLSAYAGFAFSQSLPAALALATLVTIAGVALSMRRGSQAIAVFAVYGAVITPLMMPASSHLGPQSSALLFAYLALLNVSTLIISRFRYWPWQAASSLVATHVLAWLWFGDHRDSNPLLTLIFPCTTFVVYFLRPLVQQRKAAWQDIGIAVANTLMFLAALQTLLFLYAPQLLPYAPAALGVLHGAAAALFSSRRGLTPTHLVMMVLLLAPGSVSVAPGLAPLVWLGMGVLLGWIGLRYESWSARMAGYLLVAACMALNPRAYVVLPAAAAGVWYLRRCWRECPHSGDFEWLARWALAIGIMVGGLAATTMEMRALLALPALVELAPGAHFLYSLCIAFYGAVIGFYGRRSSSLFFRTCGLLVFAVLTAKVFLYDLAALSGMWRIGSLTLLAVSLLLLSLRTKSAIRNPQSAID